MATSGIDDIRDKLRTAAPVTTGTGPKAVAVVKEIARKLFPHFADDKQAAFNVYRVMDQEWSPRCAPPWGKKLWRIVDEAKADYDQERAAAEARRAAKAEEYQRDWAARRERKYQEELRRERERKISATEHARISAALDVSLRRARDLRTHGTTLREQAEGLALILGGEPDDYFHKRRYGRKVNLVALFMRAKVDDCDFLDFLDDVPEDLDADARDLVDALRTLGAANFKDHDALVSYLESEFEPFTTDATMKVWRAWTLWRIESVARLAAFAVDSWRGHW